MATEDEIGKKVNPGPLQPELEPEIAPAPNIKPKQKILVEGINAPRSPKIKVALTPQEQELISQPAKPQLQPQTLQPNPQIFGDFRKKRHPVRNTFITLIILLILAGTAYALYARNGYRFPSLSSVLQTSPENQQPEAPVTADQLDSSSTNPFLYNQTSTTTATSTLTSLSTSTPPAVTPQPTTTPAFQQQLKINSTPTGYLNVRSSPSSSGKIITQVHPGETYPYSQSQNGWYDITLASGQTGWVSGQYITTQ